MKSVGTLRRAAVNKVLRVKASSGVYMLKSVVPPVGIGNQSVRHYTEICSLLRREFLVFSILAFSYVVPWLQNGCAVANLHLLNGENPS